MTGQETEAQPNRIKGPDVSLGKLFMIRHGNATIGRRTMTQYHVAARLVVNLVSEFLKSGNQRLPRNAGQSVQTFTSTISSVIQGGMGNGGLPCCPTSSFKKSIPNRVSPAGVLVPLPDRTDLTQLHRFAIELGAVRPRKRATASRRGDEDPGRTPSTPSYVF